MNTAVKTKTVKPATIGPLDATTLAPSILPVLARFALIGLVTGPALIEAGAIDADKRSQAKTLRELLNAGWLRVADGAGARERYQLTLAAIEALAIEPTSELPVWWEERGERLPLPCSPVLALATFGTSSKTDEMRAMVWRLIHHDRFRWALVPSERTLYQGFCRFPIPLDNAQEIAPQVQAIDAEWSWFADNYRTSLDLVVSDDATVLRYQQARARSLWKLNRGRTLLAIARFGGYSKDDDADESAVDEIPPLGTGFLHARTPDHYDPKRSWEDEAQRQLTEADEAIERATARRVALLKRYTKVAIENPGPRPYDAMRTRFEQWIAEYIIAQTGVDPRTLPET